MRSSNQTGQTKEELPGLESSAAQTSCPRIPQDAESRETTQELVDPRKCRQHVLQCCALFTGTQSSRLFTDSVRNSLPPSQYILHWWSNRWACSLLLLTAQLALSLPAVYSINAILSAQFRFESIMRPCSTPQLQIASCIRLASLGKLMADHPHATVSRAWDWPHNPRRSRNFPDSDRSLAVYHAL